MVKIIRITALSLHITSAAMITFILATAFRLDSHHPVYKRITRWWFATICKILRVNTQVTGEIEVASVMYVSNHVSWLDIPLIASHANPRFLSKQDIRHWPLIGWLAEKSGTLFIARGNQGAAHQAKEKIGLSLQKKQNVLIFPEGTTTSGESVRRFHARLFSAAIETNTFVQPIAIRYIDENGEPDTIVPYIDEQSFVQNLRNLLEKKEINAQIHFLSPVNVKGKSRNELAKQCETVIADHIKS